MNIVLIGFMGAGKTSVGKALREKTGMEMIDTDEKIEKDSGMKISKIFSTFGEEYFRKLEKKAVREVSKLENTIIVTGGGVVLDKENMENLRKKGIVIHLYADPKTIYERIKHESHRPLLQVEDPIRKIKELLEYRARFYADNDIVIDTSNLSVDEVAEKILEKLNKKCRC
jgi:shikimate kinase